jgi:hypothetical protein
MDPDTVRHAGRPPDPINTKVRQGWDLSERSIYRFQRAVMMDRRAREIYGLTPSIDRDEAIKETVVRRHTTVQFAQIIELHVALAIIDAYPDTGDEAKPLSWSLRTEVKILLTESCGPRG